MPLLNVALVPAPDQVVVRLTGDADLSTVPLLADALTQAAGLGTRDLVVDVALGIALPEREQPRVEVPLLGLCVHLEEDLQARPDRTQGLGVVARHLVEDGEHAALLVVLLEDDLGDVHARSMPADRGGHYRSRYLSPKVSP